MKIKFPLAAAAALLCAITPRPATAQAGAQSAVPPAGGCVTCYIASGGATYECKAGSPGGTSCTLSGGGTSCSVSGPCQAAPNPAPIDGVANLTSPELLQNAGSEGSFALVTDVGDGRNQLRARCNGVVLARAYTETVVETLRSQTSMIEL